MNIQKILSESSRTEENCSNGTQFFTFDDNKGFLGIPLKNDADITYREILCNNQGTEFVPYMKFIAESDGFRWYETQILERFENAIRYFWALHHESIRNMKDFENNIEFVYYDVLMNLANQVPSELVLNTEFDLHSDNVRQDKDGNLYFCDIFVYRDYKII